MKAGMVIQVRVNPGDCQSVLDLMGLLNVDPYDGRSFAQCVSMALSSMLGSFRQNKLLPEVDTFQYLNRMGPFLGSKNNKRKSAMADALYRQGGRDIASIQLPTREVEHPGQYIPESIQGWTENGAVDTANVPMIYKDEDTEVLVTLFHKLKNSKSVEGIRKCKEVEKELDKRNRESQQQTGVP